MALIAAKNVLCRWDQKACELLHNMQQKVGDYVEKWFILYLSQIVVHEVINKIHSTFWFCLVIWICICNETALMSSQFTQYPVLRYPFRCEWHKFCCKQFSWVCNISLNNYWAVLINKGTHYEFSYCALMVFCYKNYWSLHLTPVFWYDPSRRWIIPKNMHPLCHKWHTCQAV